MTAEPLSPHEVALRVRPYVTGKHVGDIALRMDDACIHLRNGYWNVRFAPCAGRTPCFPIMRHWPRLRTKCRNGKVSK